jgi:hypothetical protein
LEEDIVHKYIAPNVMLDWIINPRKSIENVSNQWKALVLDFTIIGNHLAWKVGNGRKVRIGVDAILVFGHYILLPLEMIQHFHYQGCYTLNNILDHSRKKIWN